MSWTGSSWLVVTGSWLFFRINRDLLWRFVPSKIKDEYRRSWAWVNVANSFIHAFVTGVGSVLCLHSMPGGLINILDRGSASQRQLHAFSFGYFIHDSREMFLENPDPIEMSMVVHHSVVIIIILFSLLGQRLIAFCTFAYLMELANVFLHARQLLRLSRANRRSLIYYTFTNANLAAFIFIRMPTVVWLGVSLLLHPASHLTFDVLVGYLSVFIVFIYSCRLLAKLVRSDFIMTHKDTGDKGIKSR